MKILLIPHILDGIWTNWPYFKQENQILLVFNRLSCSDVKSSKHNSAYSTILSLYTDTFNNALNVTLFMYHKKLTGCKQVLSGYNYFFLFFLVILVKKYPFSWTYWSKHMIVQVSRTALKNICIPNNKPSVCLMSVLIHLVCLFWKVMGSVDQTSSSV